MSARLAAQYDLYVGSYGFDRPEATTELRRLVASGVGMTPSEFKKKMPGPYFDWFGDQVTVAYQARSRDFKLWEDIRDRCIERFPESAQ